jgi:hypothetical protein
MSGILQSFTLVVKTGEYGNPELPRYAINGFPLDFEESSGGCGPGEIFHATGYPESFPHSLLLVGPSDGVWDLEETSVTLWIEGERPYTVRLGSVQLDNLSDLNLWYEPPLPVYHL